MYRPPICDPFAIPPMTKPPKQAGIIIPAKTKAPRSVFTHFTKPEQPIIQIAALFGDPYSHIFKNPHNTADDLRFYRTSRQKRFFCVPVYKIIYGHTFFFPARFSFFFSSRSASHGGQPFARPARFHRRGGKALRQGCAARTAAGNRLRSTCLFR